MREIAVSTLSAAFEVSDDAALSCAAVERGNVTVSLPADATAASRNLETGDWLSFEDNKEFDSGRREPEYRAAWRHGVLVVEREPVSAVIAKVARWRCGKIVVMPGLGSRRVSGIYDLRDPLAVLEAVAAPFSGKIRQITPWLVVVSPV